MFAFFFLLGPFPNDSKEFFDLLFSINNPIYYALIIIIIIVFIIYFFYQRLFLPSLIKHNIEKESIELRSTRLMALFAELDPDPVIRIDKTGAIIQTNDAAKFLNDFNDILNKNIVEIFPFFDFDISASIEKSRSTEFEEEINGKYYSILFRGDENLSIAQVYFRDITQRKQYEEKIIKSGKQIKELSEHLQNILEEERVRIANELHDGIGQNLSLIRLKLIRYSEEDNKEQGNKYEGNGHYNEIVTSLEETINELKNISYRLKPKILEELGLGPALTSLVEKVSKDMRIKGSINVIGFEERLDNKLETYLFRVAQEAISNIVKHADASEFNINLFTDAKALRLIVSDNGKGFDPEEMFARKDNSKGMGLFNIRERVQYFGGKLKVDSSSGEGTLIIIEIPLEQI